MSFKKETGNKKVVKGFTLVEIIVVLVILAILAAATIPSLLGFIDDAKFKTIDNEARVVRNAAQAYATEQSAGGKTDEFIEGKINGVINSEHALHYLLQNDANGTVFMTKVEGGKIKKFNYTKEIIDQNDDFISDKVRYVVFDDTKSALLHATDPITNINIDNFKAKIIEEVTTALTSNDPESLKSTLTSSLTTDVASSLKTNFVTELGSDVVNVVYPVGSYYVSHSSTSPTTLFPGTTWTQIESKFLYCMPASNAKKPENSSVALSVGDTGGSTTHTHTTGNHTLTINEIPSHSHKVMGTDGAGIEVGKYAVNNSGVTSIHLTSLTPSLLTAVEVGGGQTHNHGDTGSTSNIPPYVAVYCWRRTS